MKSRQFCVTFALKATQPGTLIGKANALLPIVPRATNY